MLGGVQARGGNAGLPAIAMVLVRRRQRDQHLVRLEAVLQRVQHADHLRARKAVQHPIEPPCQDLGRLHAKHAHRFGELVEPFLLGHLPAQA